MADEIDPREPLIRVNYLHAPATNRDGTEVLPRRNGRLLATVATKELAPGKLAVAISRCNIADQPSRFSGRKRAEARLQRFLAYVGDGKASFNGEDPQPLKDSQRHLTEKEIKKNLVLTMTVDELKREILEKNPFLSENCPFGIADSEG